MRRGCAAEVGAQGINLLAKNAFGGVLGGTAPHQTVPRAVPEGHAQFRHPCHFYQCHLIFKLRSVFLILPYVVFSALYASCISFHVSSRVLSSSVLPNDVVECVYILVLFMVYLSSRTALKNINNNNTII